MHSSSPYSVHVIHAGYSRLIPEGMEACCTCTLVKGPTNIIVDTMTPWDKEVLLKGMEDLNVKCEDVNLVISTHGHSDHIGNNNLFLNAKHIVGESVSFKHTYYDHSFKNGEKLIIDDFVYVMGTPGHTMTDVSLIVKTDEGVVAVVGDLFEREEDLEDSSLWMDLGASESPSTQKRSRKRILDMADYIVPGHGPAFKVTKPVKESAQLHSKGDL